MIKFFVNLSYRLWSCLAMVMIPWIEAEATDLASPSNLDRSLMMPTEPVASRTNSGQSNGRKDSQVPAVMSADLIEYDSDLSLVLARGNVEIDQGSRILKADLLTYLTRQDVIIATGSVSLTEVNGEVNFADYMELTGDMKEAAVRSMSVLQVDDSRISSASARRYTGDRTILNKAVYTACIPCADQKTPPLWVIKANQMIHDEESHRIDYEDVWIDFYGYPIVYTPYFSHLDPSIKRADGLLPVSFLSNKTVGTAVRVPYFITLGNYQDLTLEPLYSSSGDVGLISLYRLKNYYGWLKMSVSAVDIPANTLETKATIGWNISSSGIFDLNENWRFSFIAERASSQNYLDAFGYHNANPYLKVEPQLEYFSGKNYGVIEGYSFQSITSVNSQVIHSLPSLSSEPVAFPVANYSYVSDLTTSGGYWTSDLHSAVLTRSIHRANTQQFNSFTSYHQPYITEDGQQIQFLSGLRGDGYNSFGLTSGPVSQIAGRALPIAAVDWRYPLINVGDHMSQMITPIIMAAASPNGANPRTIPNQDSLDFELDDRNIFSATPSNGFDRIVTGPRVAYGAHYSIVNRGTQTADMLLAQSYQSSVQNNLPSGTGFDHNFSDIVGRIDVMPVTNFAFKYSFRLNEKDYSFARHEITTSLGPRLLNLQTSFVYYDKTPDYAFNSREQISSTLTAQWTKNWSNQLYTTQNLGPGASNLDSGLRIIYEDECFNFITDIGRRDTTSKVFSAGNYLSFRIVFKTIGQLPLDIF